MGQLCLVINASEGLDYKVREFWSLALINEPVRTLKSLYSLLLDLTDDG